MSDIERHGVGFVPLKFFLAAAVVLLIAGMMVITFIDVFGRYALNSPVPGAFEFVKYMLGLSIFACYPLITRDNQHITVSIIDNLMHGRIRWVQQLIISLFSFCMMCLILLATWTQAETLRQANFVSQYLEFPVAPIVYIMFAFSGIAILIQLTLIWKHVTDYSSG